MSGLNFLKKDGTLEILKRDPTRIFKKSELTLDERVKLAESVATELIGEDEIRKIFEEVEYPVAYDGFEPSGRMHIAQGLLKADIVNKLTRAGCVFVFWVADYFALINNKLNGNLEHIQLVGEYFKHVWKAAGMDLTNVVFLDSSVEIKRNFEGYMLRVFDIAMKNSVDRVGRCSQIMGRTQSGSQPCAQLFYPCMQVADIFYLNADICQLGLDQRKVNMLAREYAKSHNDKNTKNKLRIPAVLSHEMMPGLLEGQAKMSKSNPDSAIFMDDSASEVKRKIKKAFCPAGTIENNPVIIYIKKIVYPIMGSFTLSRPEKYGGFVEYSDFEQFKQDYVDQKCHPDDVKTSLALALNTLLTPVREHFHNDPEAKALMAKIKKIEAANKK